MRIEIIYPEIANLQGEHGTQQLLRLAFTADELVYTPFPRRPRFLDESIDFVYMGGMTENNQALVLDHWRAFANKFEERIKGGQTGFFAGNALDLLGRNIIHEEGKTIQALGLYPFDTLTKRFDRRNEIISGRFREFDMLGFRSQFTTQTGDSSAFPFIEVTHGSGMNEDVRSEGICDHNFFASSLCGPLLILNPAFTKWLFRTFGFDRELPFETDLFEAAAVRKADLELHFSK